MRSLGSSLRAGLNFSVNSSTCVGSFTGVLRLRETTAFPSLAAEANASERPGFCQIQGSIKVRKPGSLLKLPRFSKNALSNTPASGGCLPPV